MEIKKGALEGVVILDLTRVLAGPYSTMILGDMGAEIIKIEIPETGDDTRALGPFQNGESLYYINLNRNKKGVTLNLKNKKGKEIFLNLVKKADVVVENYRPGTMEKLGLGYEELKKENEGLVYAAVSGFGHYGEYKDRPGYDIIGQAMGGLMSVTGWEECGSTRTGTAMGDVLGGLSVTIGILTALYNKKITGKGQKVDVSLVDSVVSSLETTFQRYFSSGRIPEKIGNRYPAGYPYDSFKAEDGEFVLGVGNDKLFYKFCKVINRYDLMSNEDYREVKNRVNRHRELKIIIEQWAKDKKVNEIVDKMLAEGVPAAPIYNVKQISEDKHIAEDREMLVTMEHPVAGDTRLTGCHIKLYDTKPSLRTPAPSLGQHNYEVMEKYLNLNIDEVDKLIYMGVM
jgi:formyl-CoA transferase